MKNYKHICIGLTFSAALIVAGCHDELASDGPVFRGDGKWYFAVGTQSEWTSETRAAHNSVTLLQPGSEGDEEPLVVLVEDGLIGDTAAAPVTRGVRYTNETETWDGKQVKVLDENDNLVDADVEHRMHPSFALMGMTFNSSLPADFSGASRWTGLEMDGNPYAVQERGTPTTDPSDTHYELWSWSQATGEIDWPDGKDVMLFALAPAQTNIDFGIRLHHADTNYPGPYFDYTLPSMAILQQDLMVAKRIMTQTAIENTSHEKEKADNPPVVLDFEHITTAVKFKLAEDNNNTGNANTLIKRITMKNVRNKGRFTFSNTETEKGQWGKAGEWSFTSTDTDDMVYDFVTPEQWNKSDKTVEEKVLTTDENVFMMIPQTFDNSRPLEVVITYIDQKDVSDPNDDKEVNLSVKIEHEWKMGHTVTYTIAKAAEVTIDDETFNVTAYHDDDSGELTNTTVTYDGANDIKQYEFTCDVEGNGDVSFRVESYKHFTIGSTHGWATIPWEITEAKLMDENQKVTDTYASGYLPNMVTMDNRTATTTIINPATNLEETVVKDETWGNGTDKTYTTAQGNVPYDLKPANINGSSSRGTADSKAMREVLNRNPIGTQANPQDISMLSLAGLPLQRRTTANCYVVSAPGYYSIPLVYGNAITNGENNPLAWKTTGLGVTSTHALAEFKSARKTITQPWIDADYTPTEAFVLWATSEDMITHPDNIKLNNLKLTERDGHYYIDFAVRPENINLGNAVVAVSDGTSILWSWHIWVNSYDEVNKVIRGSVLDPITTQPENYDFMEVNLGWTDGYTESFEDSICAITFTQKTENTATRKTKTILLKRHQIDHEVTATGGTYYQHGRKDPFPSVAINKSKPKLTQNTGDNGTIELWDSDDMMSSTGFLYNCKYTVQDSEGNDFTLQDGIKNPYLFYHPTTVSGQTNWFNEGTDGFYDNLWSMKPYTMAEDYKGVADPENIHEDVYKTVYDPCPIGYCVPNPGAFKGFYQIVEKTFHPKFVYGETSDLYKYITIYGDDSSTSPPTGLMGNQIDQTSSLGDILGTYTSDTKCITHMKANLVEYGYTIDRSVTSKPIEITGKFVKAASDVKWVDQVSGFNDARYDGIDGLVCTSWANLFFPSAGARNPDEDGETMLDGYHTFNFGGYYATAFAAPDNGNLAAAFFWTQRNRLRDALNTSTVLIGSNEAPLFDPYNETIDIVPTADNYFTIWIYRNSNHRTDNALYCWGYGTDLSGVGGNAIPRVNEHDNHGVDLYLTRYESPQQYTPKEWGRKRSFGLSVRAIRDKNFSDEVGIVVRESSATGTGGVTIQGTTPYRNTLSRRR